MQTCGNELNDGKGEESFDFVVLSDGFRAIRCHGCYPEYDTHTRLVRMQNDRTLYQGQSVCRYPRRLDLFVCLYACASYRFWTLAIAYLCKCIYPRIALFLPHNYILLQTAYISHKSYETKYTTVAPINQLARYNKTDRTKSAKRI